MKYLALVVVLGLIFVAGCTVSHTTMRGHVVDVLDGETYVCIGKEDGLKVGDLMTVYRTRQIGVSHLPDTRSRSKGEILRSYSYEKIKVGTVKVTRLVEEHFAVVESVGGEIDYPDIVEKKLTR